MNRIKVDYRNTPKLGLQLCEHIWLGGLHLSDEDGDMPPAKIGVFCKSCGKTFNLALLRWF